MAQGRSALTARCDYFRARAAPRDVRVADPVVHAAQARLFPEEYGLDQ